MNSFYRLCLFVLFGSLSLQLNAQNAQFLSPELKPAVAAKAAAWGGGTCTDTIYTVPHANQYYYFGTCNGYSNLGTDIEISGSQSAAATADSAIAWMVTYDNDSTGPNTAWPDSLIAGSNPRNSTNRAPYVGGFTPQYLITHPQISPFALHYFVVDQFRSKGVQVACTPISFDSIDATNHLYDLDACFGIGEPVLITFIPQIQPQHWFSCVGGQTYLSIVPQGGWPAYVSYHQIPDNGSYTVTVNGSVHKLYAGDTLTMAVQNPVNYSVLDSLVLGGLADGCAGWYDTLSFEPQITVTGLTTQYADTVQAVNISVAPAPETALRIDYFTSEAATTGISVIDNAGNTVFNQYPLGADFGSNAVVDKLNTIYIYHLPLSGRPYSVIAGGDDGLGWQYASCYGLNYDGYLQVFDPATGDSLSTKLFPVGDNNCGNDFTTFTDTFPGFSPGQYNKVQLSFNGNPHALTAVDSLGNAVFYPDSAGAGNYFITLTVNDNISGACDKDTVFPVKIQSITGINSLAHPAALIQNPVGDWMFLQTGGETFDMLNIYDLRGALVHTYTGPLTNPIDTHFLSPGAYLVTAGNSHSTAGFRQLIVKQ